MKTHLLIALEAEQRGFLPSSHPTNLVCRSMLPHEHYWPAVGIIIFLLMLRKRHSSWHKPWHSALCNQQLSLLTWDTWPPVCIQIWWLWRRLQGALCPRHLWGSSPHTGWTGRSFRTVTLWRQSGSLVCHPAWLCTGMALWGCRGEGTSCP